MVNGEEIVLAGAELAAEEARIQAEVDAETARVAATGYIDLRVVAYGKIGNQLDMIFHDIDNETLDKTGEFYAHVHGVKADYPKPE